MKKVISLLLTITLMVTMMSSFTMISLAADNTSKPTIVMLKAKASGTKTVNLSWTKVNSATKYVVYGNKKGKTLKKLVTVKSNKYTVGKIKGTKLKANKYYKFYVVAYKGKTKLAKSNTICFITGNTCGKYANASRITAARTELNLKTGQKATVKATTKIYKNKKHIPSSCGAARRYVSKNPAVAKVNNNGLVTAVSEGTATIFIQDIGGLYCRTVVKVTVNQDKIAFDQYKQDVIIDCDTMLELISNTTVKTAVADAKEKIQNISFNASKSLDANKKAIDDIYSNLLEKVQAHRDLSDLSDIAAVLRTILFGKTRSYDYVIKENIEYGDRPSNTLDLYIPENAKGRSSNGCILFIHGGGWSMGDKTDFAQDCKRYARKGYVTATMNYSLSDISDPVSVDTMLDEITGAISKIKEYSNSQNINVTKIATGGYSAGAHLALMYAYKNYEQSPLPISFTVSLSGPTNFNLPEFDNNKLFWLRLLIDKSKLDKYISQGRINDAATSISPVTYVTKSVPPTIAIHGKKDNTCNFMNYESLIDKLEKCGATYKGFIAPNSDHDLQGDDDVLKVFFNCIDSYCIKYFKY